VRRINIEEIENGFVVELFDTHGPSSLDKTVFCSGWDEVTKAVLEWRKQEDNPSDWEKKEA
jgi:hypothetical protein